MKRYTIAGALAFVFGLSDAAQLQEMPHFSPQSPSSCSDPSSISFAQSWSPFSVNTFLYGVMLMMLTHSF